MSGDCMRFPDTVEEFMKQYKVVDKEGIYMSKGAELVPIFRMDQWFEHEKAQLSQEGTTKDATSDLISRQAAIDMLCSKCTVDKPETCSTIQKGDNWCEEVYILQRVPSAQPERKKGKWIYNSPVTMKCDQCGLVIKDWDWHRFKFCPNCDCDMRGEQK